jgi:hypothetical protein
MSDPLNTPILWINEYLKEKISEEVFGLNNGEIFSGNSIPFFPTGPSTIDLVTEQFVNNGQEAIAVYDRMFRRRKRAFPHIKCEQVLYYFYANGNNDKLNMIKIQESLMNLMDREDESAEEINAWAIAKGTIQVKETASDGSIQTYNFNPAFHFHSFRIYQLEEARDIVDFGTARTFAGNKIIIDYDYHSIKS